jgi:hypothetical protein
VIQQLSGAIIMPINRLLKEGVFGPEDIEILTAAFEDTLRELCLLDRSDSIAEIAAKKIVELARSGERDPARLREQTVLALSEGNPWR